MKFNITQLYKNKYTLLVTASFNTRKFQYCQYLSLTPYKLQIVYQKFKYHWLYITLFKQQ